MSKVHEPGIWETKTLKILIKKIQVQVTHQMVKKNRFGFTNFTLQQQYKYKMKFYHTFNALN